MLIVWIHQLLSLVLSTTVLHVILICIYMHDMCHTISKGASQATLVIVVIIPTVGVVYLIQLVCFSDHRRLKMPITSINFISHVKTNKV